MLATEPAYAAIATDWTTDGAVSPSTGAVTGTRACPVERAARVYETPGS